MHQWTQFEAWPEGVTHSGVVTFHELGPRLTRVQVSLDVETGAWRGTIHDGEVVERAQRRRAGSRS
jgi:hypothetical protein